MEVTTTLKVQVSGQSVSADWLCLQAGLKLFEESIVHFVHPQVNIRDGYLLKDEKDITSGKDYTTGNS